MSLQPPRLVCKFVTASLVSFSMANEAAAAVSSSPRAGSGTLDDWLALGLALLAALYCVQKRE